MSMGVDFSTFKELTPQSRVKELKKLVNSLRKEIEDRDNDIKQAEHLLAIANDEQTVLEKAIEHVDVPKPAKKEPKIEDIAQVATEEEPGHKINREEQLELEKLLATSPPRSDELLHRVAHRPVNELYSELKNIYDRQQETGLEMKEDRDRIYAIRKGFEIKREDGYKPAKKDQHIMTAGEEMANTMYSDGSGGTYKSNP